ncbi:MAG: hypothetical protein WCX73_04920 [Candidatus Pacearchaeota archaeon]|jgi:hypothetical protein
MEQFILNQKEVDDSNMSERLEKAKEFLRELDRITDRNILVKTKRIISIQEALLQLRKLEIGY